MRRRVVVPLCMAACLATAFPVSAEVVWLEKNYDFGLIKEEAGPQTGHVRLYNSGPEEIVITGARPSCGCTGVAYPEDPIAPGDTVNFSFTYNPIGRPGKFDKSIRVYIGDYDMATIKIRGNVLGTPESLTSMYPVEVGPLRLSASIMDAGDVTYGSARHFFLNGYNQTPDTIYPSWECADKGMSISSSAEAVGPGDIITLSFYFNSREHPEMGPLDIPVTIKADNTPGAPQTQVSFLTKVTPDFSRMTPEQVKDAPQCYLAPPMIDLGEIQKADKRVKLKFEIRNDGKTEMRVIRIFSTNKAVKITRYPTSVKPAKTGTAEGQLDLTQLPAGPFNIKVEVLTNDPLHPSRTLSIAGILY